MISDAVIREEKYTGDSLELSEVLRDIPMTERQRSLVQHHLDMMELTFRKANTSKEDNYKI